MEFITVLGTIILTLLVAMVIIALVIGPLNAKKDKASEWEKDDSWRRK